ncbi:MAG: hypothetical protein ACUVX9_15715 [Anaerolineae bacterium]
MLRDRSRRWLARLAAPLDGLWWLCVRPGTLVGLSLPLAAVLLLMLLLPQAPLHASGPVALARWLTETRARFPGAAVAARAGLLTLATSPLLRLLLAALALGALVAGAEVLLAWRAAEGRGRRPALLSHAGLVLLLLAAVAQERWSWQQNLLLTSAPVAVGPESALVLERLQGPPAGPVAVSWRSGDRQGQTELRLGQPAFVAGWTLHLRASGPSVTVRALSNDGRVLLLEDPLGGGFRTPEGLLRLAEPGEARYVAIAEREWLLQVVRPSAAGDALPWAVYGGSSTTPLAAGFLEGLEGEFEVADTRVRWQVQRFAELTAAQQPALLLWPAAWLLLCVGLAWSARDHAFAWRRRWPWALGGTCVGATVLAIGAWPLRAVAPAAAAAQAFSALGAGWLLAALALTLIAGMRGQPPTDVQAGAVFLRWGAVFWMVGLGPLLLSAWLAQGALWQWQPAQVQWGLAGLLVAATLHASDRTPLCLRVGLVLAAALAAVARTLYFPT